MFYSGGAPKKRAVLRILHHTKEETKDADADVNKKKEDEEGKWLKTQKDIQQDTKQKNGH